MFGIGIEELVVILLVLLLLTGGKKLPELTKGITQSIREIRKGFAEEVQSDDEPKKQKAKKVRNSPTTKRTK